MWKKITATNLLSFVPGGIYKNLTAEKLGEFSDVLPKDKTTQIWREWKPGI